ncbi:hypothetical protein A2631_02055 [Candidatus Daviesbacteria bacterium RIFCSPHIGHO2_01_FULL_44_29]|uniref:DUF192 domain-containing protein n=1 Tax=Candidatus Daviesbacteria bacterium RIFCSPHIGHO2_02_FULL_43_12 TaxID=1797776 RepID=A0A1F5KK48_9BACT|nr:MAG: hypothetical protein A2631_02055 [Candidatus Daviesbacteria bacterium RIFCSPHIGHO2_01_FULL_44_29]OGE39544.1 MAG: hypothetical protein A3E86_01845 [Candidatus Daviesbacteria bacterium RIFCSPHIGHO2_12_FULL_47_45]OGE41180.1 MAG: hypothetical protein A3D25_01450 [Candidatus Daviesbacteria bacterium RIFCSPHIGHO2_02_FULL_43_12]OGE69379.1 MAG: hypothetical protein A3B55_03190 [Candidatus Daviesbacteria bacterium RIFCSPLOWO2_01_FULL_43_15]
MKKFFIQLILLVVLTFLFLEYALKPENFSAFLGGFDGGTPSETQTQVKIASTTITVDVADTKAKRAKGLGGRTSLDPNSGMLFIFDSPAKQRFWMKGLQFPLDIIFISNNRIVDIMPNIQPPMEGQIDSELPIYTPKTESDMVLEVNGGFVSSHNIHIGDTIEVQTISELPAD